MNGSGRRLNKQSAGFTLSEIMVTLGLVSVVASAVLALAQIQASIQREQNRLQAAQDNARAALQILAEEARLIGAPSRGYGVVNATGTGPPTLPIYHVIDNYEGRGADRLELIVPRGSLYASTTSLVDTASTLGLEPLDPQRATPFSTSNLLLASNLSVVAAPLPPPLLSAASACGGMGTPASALIRVTEVMSGGTLQISPMTTGGCRFPKGTLVAKAQVAAYFLDEKSQLVVAEEAQLGLPLALVPLAEQVADLQIAVGVDGLNGNPLDGILTERGEAANDDEWALNVDREVLPVQPPSALRITVIARTIHGEGPLGLGRPAVENRPQGEPDRLRYRVLSTTVVPRNLIRDPE